PDAAVIRAGVWIAVIGITLAITGCVAVIVAVALLVVGARIGITCIRITRVARIVTARGLLLRRTAVGIAIKIVAAVGRGNGRCLSSSSGTFGGLCRGHVRC